MAADISTAKGLTPTSMSAQKRKEMSGDAATPIVVDRQGQDVGKGEATCYLA